MGWLKTLPVCHLAAPWLSLYLKNIPLQGKLKCSFHSSWIKKTTQHAFLSRQKVYTFLQKVYTMSVDLSAGSINPSIALCYAHQICNPCLATTWQVHGGGLVLPYFFLLTPNSPHCPSPSLHSKDRRSNSTFHPKPFKILPYLGDCVLCTSNRPLGTHPVFMRTLQRSLSCWILPYHCDEMQPAHCMRFLLIVMFCKVVGAIHRALSYFCFFLKQVISWWVEPKTWGVSLFQREWFRL